MNFRLLKTIYVHLLVCYLMDKSGNMWPKYAPPTAFVIIIEGLGVSQKEVGGGGKLIISKPSGHIQMAIQQSICAPVNSKAGCFNVELVK